MNPLDALDYAAVFVFALTGALTASRAQLDIIGFVFLASLTAVGGGTIRDLLLDRNPIFWIEDPRYILIASLAAALVFVTAHRFESRLRLILWLDALALSVAVSAGVGVALSTGQSAIIVALMGAVTGTMGGLMRDVVANEVPLALKQGELYVTAAFAGAIAALFTTELTNHLFAPLAACTVVTLVLRAGSIAFGWRLPVYKSRPPKQ
ncbi:trimeric intracellular cation channel family protein [Roseobacter sp. N2S]|uniref:trimeric intracellular cation channel family protein n=1 Tax=Roseobacter sp. N2S TaxID=2663844 RepID=UPI00285911B9|nr:trimeric intracellular cation channel family protein [Roseobacter sp. N2S]MDR6267216.1 putative membrane protein YeiH [Roseobacter sp. N2S]